MDSAAFPFSHSPFLLLMPLLILAYLPPPALPLSFNYSSMGNSVRQYLVDKGNVSFSPQYVELTWFYSDPSDSAGRVYNEDELPLWNSATKEAASFNCSFTFSIIPITDEQPADGLAFFLLDPSLSEIPQQAKGLWLGLLNATTNSTGSQGVVAVEFDTFQNDFDPSDHHVGIDINSIISAEYSNLSFLLWDSTTVFAWVDYSSTESLLEVYATNLSSTKPSFPLISYSINLAQFLPENILIGFSAATGRQSEYHRLLSWSFNSTSITPPPGTQSKTKGSHEGLLVGLISTLVLVSVVAMVLFLVQKERRKKRPRRDQTIPPSNQRSADLPFDSLDVGLAPHKFHYRDLSQATNDFDNQFLLGEGGFGSVYKGVLPDDGSEVAVKCISQKSAQGEREFLAEVCIISRIRHKNLVQLKGWCRENSRLLLVYEYLRNGSLDRHLFSQSSTLTLDWNRRYNILCGLGSALQYLHQECEKVIVHRDIKASNVMLDAAYNAKLGDFGLARQLGEGVEGHTTLAAGTVGYMAPETYGTGRATLNSDVYSYGIVLLEVVSGRRPVDTSLPTQFEGRLLDWVWDLHSKGKLREACDVRLEGAFDDGQLIRALTVGLACSHPDPQMRPSIQVALEALQGRVALPTIPTFKPVPYYGPPPSMSLLSIIMMPFSGPLISSSSSAPDSDLPERALLDERASVVDMYAGQGIHQSM